MLLAGLNDSLQGRRDEFILVMDDFKDTIERDVVYSQGDEGAGGDVVGYEAARQDGSAQAGHDDLFQGFRIIERAGNVYGGVMLCYGVEKEIPRAASFLAQVHGQAAQLLYRQGRALGQGAIGGHDDDQLVDHEGGRQQIGRRNVAFDEGQVDVVMQEHLLQLARVVDFRQRFLGRAAFLEMLEQLDEEDLADGHAGADSDRRRPAERMEGLLGLGCQRKNLPGIGQQALAGRRDVQAPSQPFK